MRPALAFLALGSLPFVTAGCYGVEDSAKIRAANEFRCPPDQVVLVPRQDLSEDTVDVYACGYRARYTCPPRRNQSVPRSCIREPLQ
jgi:hypothetical protein